MHQQTNHIFLMFLTLSTFFFSILVIYILFSNLFFILGLQQLQSPIGMQQESEASNQSFSSLQSDEQTQKQLYEDSISNHPSQILARYSINLDTMPYSSTVALYFWAFMTILLKEGFSIPFKYKQIRLVKHKYQQQESQLLLLDIDLEQFSRLKQFLSRYQENVESNLPSLDDESINSSSTFVSFSNQQPFYESISFYEYFSFIQSRKYCIYKLAKKLLRNNIPHLVLCDKIIINKSSLQEENEFNTQCLEINRFIAFIIDFQQQQPRLQELMDYLSQRCSNWVLKCSILKGMKIKFMIETFDWLEYVQIYQRCFKLQLAVSLISDKQAMTMMTLLFNAHFAESTFKEALEALTIKAQKDDFVALLQFFNSDTTHQDKLEKDLNFILDHWDLYRISYQKTLTDILNIIQYRIFLMRDYEKVYPTIKRLHKKMERVIQQKISQQSDNIQESQAHGAVDSLTDIFYNHFIQELKVKTFQNTPYYIRDERTQKKMLLSDLIEERKTYQETHLAVQRWQNVFAKSAIRIRNDYQMSNSDKEKIMTQRQTRLSFMDNIQRQRLVSYSCISCCPFFYANTNIWHPFICKTPILTTGRITTVMEEASQLKDRICYLLNNQGGVVLFDVTCRYRSVIPLGEYFTKQTQDSYLNKLYKILQGITPKPQIDQNIQITFVPMIQDPTLSRANKQELLKKTDKCYDQAYYSRPYVQGLFVTRIKVKPTTGQKVYFWMADSGKPIIPIKVGENRFQPAPGQSIRLIIKQKFEKYHIPEDITPEDKEEYLFMLPRLSCFHDGECTPPDSGIPLASPSNSSNIHSGNHSHSSQEDSKYAYMSLLLARKQDHAVIRQRLRRKGIECEIKNLYQSYNFKAAMNAAAIYHNLRFDQLLSEMSYNKEFSFNGKYAIVVCVTQFLKLSNQSENNLFSDEDLKVLKQWLNKQHPTENLRYWRYNDGGSFQFYIETESRESTVLMYFVMTQYNQKCVFRNPKNYDKLSKAEREQRIKVYYPREERGLNESIPIRPLKINFINNQLPFSLCGQEQCQKWIKNYQSEDFYEDKLIISLQEQ